MSAYVYEFLGTTSAHTGGPRSGVRPGVRRSAGRPAGRLSAAPVRRKKKHLIEAARMAASIKCDERPFKGGVWGGFAPPAKNRGVWGAAPPSQKYFENFRKNKYFKNHYIYSELTLIAARHAVSRILYIAGTLDVRASTKQKHIKT